MARAVTAYASQYQRARTHATDFVRGEVFTLNYDLSGVVAAAVTLSSVTWRVQATASIIFGAASISGKVASVICTAGYGPGSYVKCVVTDSAGKKHAQLYEIGVEASPWFDGEPAITSGASSASA